MAGSDSSRVNQAAVTAARAALGPQVGEDVAVDVVEVVRPHIERPYQLALAQAQQENAELRARLGMT